MDKRIRIRFKLLTKQRYISKLTIKPTRASDTGLYMCQIKTKSNAKLQREFQVNVNESVFKPVRLVSVTEVGQGRLEIYHRRRWGTSCHYGFTSIEASVVCRSLGYKYGGEPRYLFEKDRVFTYGIGTDPVWIKGIHCSLNTTDIKHCTGWNGNLNCYHNDDVGITCRRTPIEVPQVPVRLPGNRSEGYVEVFKDGHWGMVCNHNIGQSEVKVICKMLGFLKGGIGFKAQDTYRLQVPGIGKEILQNLKCPETASSLDDCKHEKWGEKCSSCGCNGRNSLAVRCWTNELNNTRSVRLVGSTIAHEGRVEVLHNNTWGTVTFRWIGQAGANVLCKMAGYKYGGMPWYENVPPGQGKIWIDYIECPLNASDLDECTFEWGVPDYKRHTQDVGVRCRLQPAEVPGVKVRLIGPESHLGEGRLEVFKDGYWGTVCRAYMGTSEASLFCHMLGYRYGGHILPNPDRWPSLKSSYGPPLIEYMECPWNSTEYRQCSQRYWAYTGYKLSCTLHAIDAALQCRNEPYPYYQIKLQGGQHDNEGQVSVKFQESWIKVCRSRFKSTNIAPICKQLGYRHGGEFWIKQALDGLHTESLDIECNGKEQNIGQCNRVRKHGYCSDNKAVYVKCYQENDIELQMSVSVESNGKVTVQRNGTAWKICPTSWDNIGSATVCRMLKKRSGIATYVPHETSNRRYPPAENNIDDLYCPRNVTNLGDCFYGSWEPVACKYDNSYKTLRGGVSCF